MEFQELSCVGHFLLTGLAGLAQAADTSHGAGSEFVKNLIWDLAFLNEKQ